jgi:hypothetical protein
VLEKFGVFLMACNFGTLKKFEGPSHLSEVWDLEKFGVILSSQLFLLSILKLSIVSLFQILGTRTLLLLLLLICTSVTFSIYWYVSACAVWDFSMLHDNLYHTV